MQKAIIIGASGMVGTQLLKQVLASDQYSEVLSLVRKPGTITHPKLSEITVDFSQPIDWEHLVTGDVLFSTLGTTLAKAGSKDAQYQVDFHYQYNVAKAAAKNEVNAYVLVSSAGASAKSGNFYLKMKGQLEDAVKMLPFNVFSILQPGQLDGQRKEKRITENLALKIMYGFNQLGLLKKYRPIHAEEVAKAMLKVAFKKQSGTYTLDQIFDLIQ